MFRAFPSPLCALLLLGVAACEGNHLTPTATGVSIEAEQLEFPVTYVGSERSLSLALLSTSRQQQQVHVAVAPPFRTAEALLTLRPGERRLLEVVFVPQQPEQAKGTLVLSWEGGQRELTVQGEARAVPACSTSGPCRSSRFDTEAGTCVETPLLDGSFCANACLEEGSCEAGTCVGRQRSCDDGNACTLDSCNPASGCDHVEEACAQPESPCQAALCDPTKGCTTVDVPDGIPCGDVSCAEAHLCLVGRCEVRPLAEGATCAPASPCQGAGVCRNDVCVQPEAQVLQPVWSVESAESGYIESDVRADAAGNLYWAEYLFLTARPLRHELVSVTRDGVLRFRRSLSLTSRSLLHFIVIGGYVFAGADEEYAVHDARNGEPVWSRSLEELVPSARHTGWVTSDGRDTVFLSLTLAGTTPQDMSGALAAVSLSNGELRWVQPHLDPTASCAADAHGNVFLSVRVKTAEGGWEQEIHSYDGLGRRRWGVRPAPALGSLRAVASGRLFIDGGVVLSTSDGLPLYRLGATSETVTFHAQGALVSGQDGLLVNQVFRADDAPVREEDLEFLHFVPWTGAVLTQNPAPDYGATQVRTYPLLSNRSTVLSARLGLQGEQTLLQEFGMEGHVRFACPLALPGDIRGDTPVLTAGRWVSVANVGYLPRQVVAYDVGSVAPASRGWTTAYGGNPGGSRQEQ